MSIKGAPESFIKICQGLHELTRYAVRIHGGVSSEYEADKGLREGCPSSPPFFNLYHQGVMEDFRIRRRQLAQQTGHKPGIQWVVKADGRIDHGVHSREHLRNKAVTVTLADVGFADDTCLMGEAEEMRGAEQLLENSMKDWREKVHPGKTEGLRLSARGRAPFDVRDKGEDAVVRHVGGRLMETGGQQSDTSRRRSSGFHKIAKAARSWQFGARSQQRKMPRSIRVKIMKAVLMPTLTCFGRSRSWTRDSVKSTQQVINHAVRRCLNVRHRWKRAHHVKSVDLNELVQWEPFLHTIARQNLFWLGHLARMQVQRLPKQAAAGFWEGHKIRVNPAQRQGQWFKFLLAQIQVSQLDWFRLGDGAPRINERQFECHTRKRQRVMEWDQETGLFQCPRCEQGFPKSNGLKAHYEDLHGVADPTKMTVQMYTCEFCQQTWRVESHRREHVCPVNPRLRGPPKVHPVANCRKYGIQVIVPNLERHEDVCRGPGAANRTCNRCGKVLGSVQARKNHEARSNC